MPEPPPHTPGAWRLIYFDAPTRGEQIRVLFAVAGVPFDDVRVTPFPSGLDPYRKAVMGDASPLLGTDLCPAVTSPSGEHCVETADIMRFVGRGVGLAPATEAADARAMELTLVAQTLLDEVFYALLKPMCVRRILRSEFLGALSFLSHFVASDASTAQPTATLRARLPELEQDLASGGGPYFMGEQVSYADVAIFSVVRECLAFECFQADAELGACPRLAAFMAKLEEKASPWFATRARDHQLGFTDTIEYLCATNTPFPWSRKKPHPKLTA